jgi:hypothetical protein
VPEYDPLHQAELAAKEMAALDSKGVLFTCVFDGATLATLVAQVQTALRHPQNVGASAELARRAVAKIMAEIEIHAPQLAVLLRDGQPAESKVKA